MNVRGYCTNPHSSFSFSSIADRALNTLACSRQRSTRVQWRCSRYFQYFTDHFRRPLADRHVRSKFACHTKFVFVSWVRILYDHISHRCDFIELHCVWHVTRRLQKVFDQFYFVLVIDRQLHRKKIIRSND